MSENHLAVEMGGYSAIPRGGEESAEERNERSERSDVELMEAVGKPTKVLPSSSALKKKPVKWWLVLPLIFLSLSQAFQWAVIIKGATIVMNPLEKATAIMEKINATQFNSGITNAENLAKQIDTPEFYSALASMTQTIVPVLQRSLPNLIDKIDRQEFYDALASMEKTIVPALKKALPALITHIDTAEFYKAFDQMQNAVIPEIVKLLPTFDRFPKFLNETEQLIHDVEGLLHRWNFTVYQWIAVDKEDGFKIAVLPCK